jgi:hypothetical protein
MMRGVVFSAPEKVPSGDAIGARDSGAADENQQRAEQRGLPAILRGAVGLDQAHMTRTETSLTCREKASPHKLFEFLA